MARTTSWCRSRTVAWWRPPCPAPACSSSMAWATTSPSAFGRRSSTPSSKRLARRASPSQADAVVVLAGSLDGISPALAVLAGLVSFVSPCVLPLVPAYLAYLGAKAGQPVAVTAVRSGGAATRDSARLAPAVRYGSPSFPVATAGLGFVAGLSLIFILFFYLFSFAVQPFRD